MAKVVVEWADVAERTLDLLFSGSEAGINALTHLIKDGTFVAGAKTTPTTPPPPTLDEIYKTANKTLEKSVAKAFFAHAIPNIWTASGAFPFVVDSGMSCGFGVPFVLHVAPEMIRTRTCCSGQWYYLSGLGDTTESCDEISGCTPNSFSVLHGIEALEAGEFGGVTTADIICG